MKRHPSSTTSVERHQIYSMATYQKMPVERLAQLFRLSEHAVKEIIQAEEEDRR